MFEEEPVSFSDIEWPTYEDIRDKAIAEVVKMFGEEVPHAPGDPIYVLAHAFATKITDIQGELKNLCGILEELQGATTWAPPKNPQDFS